MACLVPSGPHRPNLLPLQNPRVPHQRAYQVLLITLYPTIFLGAKVPVVLSYTTFWGGEAGDLTSIYFTVWAFDSHFPNRHLHIIIYPLRPQINTASLKPNY
jgi:hypothetical protein